MTENNENELLRARMNDALKTNNIAALIDVWNKMETLQKNKIREELSCLSPIEQESIRLKVGMINEHTAEDMFNYEKIIGNNEIGDNFQQAMETIIQLSQYIFNNKDNIASLVISYNSIRNVICKNNADNENEILRARMNDIIEKYLYLLSSKVKPEMALELIKIGYGK